MRALRDRAFWTFMVLAALTFVFVARSGYDGIHNARQLQWIRSEMEKAQRQISTVKDQNAWSIEGRAQLRRDLDEIRAVLGRSQ